MKNAIIIGRSMNPTLGISSDRFDVWIIIDGLSFCAEALHPLGWVLQHTDYYCWKQINEVPNLIKLSRRDTNYLRKRAWILVDPLSERDQLGYVHMLVDIKDLRGR